jgi:hypothetical protein
MNAVNRAIEWSEQYKGCGWACVKCNFNLRLKFEALDAQERTPIVEAIHSCSLEDFEAHQQVLWMLALFTDAEFDQFARKWASRAPFERRTAWHIIHLSSSNHGSWRFGIPIQPATWFKPHFHLHPSLAPVLLAATLRADTETEDAVALLEYFEPIAHAYPVLKDALPLWRREQTRREDDRKAEWARQAERTQIEKERLKAVTAVREAQFQAVEASGPEAVLRVIRDSASLADCPFRWARLPETTLGSVSQDILDQVTSRLAAERVSRGWRSLHRRIVHFLKSRTHSTERKTYLSSLEHLPLLKRLDVASQSRWSLTYFPEEWAEEVLLNISGIPSDLRQQLLAKLMRLRRQSAWRRVRWALRRLNAQGDALV